MRASRLDQAREHVPQVGASGPRLHPAHLEPGQVEQHLDLALEPDPVAPHRREDRAVGLVLEQVLQRPEDEHQRGAELVAHVGEEAGPGLAQGLELGLGPRQLDALVELQPPASRVQPRRQARDAAAARQERDPRQPVVAPAVAVQVQPKVADGRDAAEHRRRPQPPGQEEARPEHDQHDADDVGAVEARVQERAEREAERGEQREAHAHRADEATPHRGERRAQERGEEDDQPHPDPQHLVGDVGRHDVVEGDVQREEHHAEAQQPSAALDEQPALFLAEVHAGTYREPITASAASRPLSTAASAEPADSVVRVQSPARNRFGTPEPPGASRTEVVPGGDWT